MAIWAPMLLPFAVTAAWLFLPGLLCGTALRLRPVHAWGLAPLFSLAVIASAAILAPMLGLGWGPLPAGGLALVLAGILWGARLLTGALRRRRAGAAWHPPLAADADPSATDRPSPAAARGALARVRRVLASAEVLTALAMAVGGVLMARAVILTLGTPDALSQTFDNIFHQNAVRWILDGASPSSLDLLSLTATPGDPTFYPAAWHDTVSLVLLTTGGTNIPLATNALALAVCALVWPAGTVLLCRAVLPSSLLRLGLLPAGVLSAAFPLFPLLFIVFGVLYPNLLGLSLLPAMLVLVLRFLGIGRREGISLPAVLVGGLLGSIAVSLAHPNASMSLVAMVIPMAAVGAVGAVLRAAEPRARGTLLSAVLLAALAIGLFQGAKVIWPIIRPPEEALTWPPTSSIPAAIGRALTFDAAAGMPAWSLMVMLLIGAYASVRVHRAELLGAWIVVVYLWVAISGWEEGEARTALVGVWYNDPYRLAAVLAVPAVPILALGVAHLSRRVADLVAPLLRRAPRPARGALWPVVGVAAAVTALLVTQNTDWMRFALRSAAWSYQLTEDSNVLTIDEHALIERLPEHVPSDAVIITDAWKGASMAYPYTGITTTSHHTLEHATDEDQMFEQHLREASTNPAVCAAVQEVGADYVLDFGGRNVNDSPWDFPGFHDLDEAPGFTLVDSQGEAALYRIDACAS